MPGFFVRMLITALGLWLASEIVPRFHFAGVGTLLAAALLLGIVNAVVRPVLILLTLPITIFTLGLFLLVINAAMVGFVAWLLKGFTVGGFGPALLGSLIISITSWIASSFIGPSGRVKTIYVREE
jgi:putative membrane protein